MESLTRLGCCPWLLVVIGHLVDGSVVSPRLNLLRLLLEQIGDCQLVLDIVEKGIQGLDCSHYELGLRVQSKWRMTCWKTRRLISFGLIRQQR